MTKENKEKNAKNNNNNHYTAKDIYVLEGLDPVRKRPGMYVGSTGVDGLHHLIWEVVDNSIDEAMGGFAKNISVVLLPGDTVTVTDDGRGIPVDTHKQTKKSALETVMTTLHAGGKFGGEAYKVAGGLHGVGVSVVNALSEYLVAEVCRDGEKWRQEYQRGKAKIKIKKIGACENSGTTVTFKPDREIFKTTVFDLDRVLEHIRQQAYLTAGVRVAVYDKREKEARLHRDYSFCFEGGIKSYVRYINRHFISKQETIFYANKTAEGIQVEIALQYIDDLQAKELGFANNIYTPEGGMHLTGFRTALTRTLNNYAKANKFIKPGEDAFTGDDVREGLSAVISVKLREPQFEGQTKAKLGNPEARSAVESVFDEAFSAFLEEYPQEARSIMEKTLLAMKARKAAKAAKETVLRKGILEGLALPGKLADCQTRDASEAELFIVEGDSAGGSAKMARDRRTQAILSLRGKPLNVEKARLDKMLASKEIRHLIIALGAAIAEDFNIEKLRYRKIIIMTDADVDGSHIQTLLLTLFYRYYQPVIEAGYLYIAQPPLYQIQKGKAARYAYNEKEKERTINEFGGPESLNIQRYKGLGEMNPEQLWETTMDPKARTLKQISIKDAEEAEHTFDVLMGTEVPPRKLFIQTHAKEAKDLDV